MGLATARAGEDKQRPLQPPANTAAVHGFELTNSEVTVSSRVPEAATVPRPQRAALVTSPAAAVASAGSAFGTGACSTEEQAAKAAKDPTKFPELALRALCCLSCAPIVPILVGQPAGELWRLWQLAELAIGNAALAIAGAAQASGFVGLEENSRFAGWEESMAASRELFWAHGRAKPLLVGSLASVDWTLQVDDSQPPARFESTPHASPFTS